MRLLAIAAGLASGSILLASWVAMLAGAQAWAAVGILAGVLLPSALMPFAFRRGRRRPGPPGPS